MTSLGAALAKTVATLGVIRTKAYGMFLGSCCPAQTSQLAGPLAGIKAQPPTATSELKSEKLNRMRRTAHGCPFPKRHGTTLAQPITAINEALVPVDSLEMACFSGCVWLICYMNKRRMRASGNAFDPIGDPQIEPAQSRENEHGYVAWRL